MDRRNFNSNQNFRRNNTRRSVDNLREEMKEQIEGFRETFVKAKELKSSHTVFKKTHHDTPDNQ